MVRSVEEPPKGPLLGVGCQPLVVVNNFGDHEVEPLLGEGGVEIGVFSESAKAGDLASFACGIRGGEVVRGLKTADLLSKFETLGQKVNQRGIYVVNALADAREFRQHSRVDALGEVLCSHVFRLQQGSTAGVNRKRSK